MGLLLFLVCFLTQGQPWRLYQGRKSGDGKKFSQELRARVSGRGIARNTAKDLARIRAGARQLSQERTGHGMRERIPQKSYLGRGMPKGSRQGQYNKGPRKGHGQELGKEPSKGFRIRLNKVFKVQGFIELFAPGG